MRRQARSPRETPGVAATSRWRKLPRLSRRAAPPIRCTTTFVAPQPCDVSGPAPAASVADGVFLIKATMHELQELVGSPLDASNSSSPPQSRRRAGCQDRRAEARPPRRLAGDTPMRLRCHRSAWSERAPACSVPRFGARMRADTTFRNGMTAGSAAGLSAGTSYVM
jgi:hypothetical protein